MFRGSYHVSQHEWYVCGYHSDVMMFVIGKDKLYVVCVCSYHGLIVHWFECVGNMICAWYVCV